MGFIASYAFDTAVEFIPALLMPIIRVNMLHADHEQLVDGENPVDRIPGSFYYTSE
jgi:hypothetical protein